MADMHQCGKKLPGAVAVHITRQAAGPLPAAAVDQCLLPDEQVPWLSIRGRHKRQALVQALQVCEDLGRSLAGMLAA